MKRHLISGLIATVLGGAGISLAQTGVTVAATATPPAIVAEITAKMGAGEPQSREVEFVGRQGKTLSYRDKGGPKEASLSIDLTTVISVDFEFKIETETLNRALLARNWSGVATTLWPEISPLTPYLDITDNNAAGLAYTMGSAMIRVADGHRSARADDKARRLYLEAIKVFESLKKAEWFEDAGVARMKSALCYIALTNYPQAEAILKETDSPEIGDASWGLYWFVQASLKHARGDARGAMNAVTKSLTFENKDIDIFPDALMLSAQLYEDLLEPYQARDVYYEVAKIFPGTEWATNARTHLKFILDKGLTKGKQNAPVEMVFFGLKDDVNAKAAALLKGETPSITEDADTSIEIDEADMQSGKKGEAPANAKAGAAPEPPPDDGPAGPGPAMSAEQAAKKAGTASAGAKAASTEALK